MFFVIRFLRLWRMFLAREQTFSEFSKTFLGSLILDHVKRVSFKLFFLLFHRIPSNLAFLWFCTFITWKEKLKSEEAEIARKGVAGISGIGRTLEKFQNSTSAFANVTVDHALGTSREANALSSKFRRIVEADHHLNENEARKGKKRPNEDHDHPKTKLKHMVSNYFYNRQKLTYSLQIQKSRWEWYPY